MFKSLLYKGAYSFFERAANNRRYDAFALGNKLLEQACTSRNELSSEQCVRGFYCEFSTKTGSYITSSFFRNDRLIDEIGREIILNKDGEESCETDDFTEI